MIYLILGLIVTLAALIAFLWAGSYFFQGYIYTEPSEGLYWQAPAAGAMMTAGFAIWCFTVALSPEASTINIPIDVLHRFSAKEDMFKSLEPAKRLWAIKTDLRTKTDGEKVEYKLERVKQKQFRYVDVETQRPWNSEGVIAVEIEKPDGSKMRFDKTPTDKGQNLRYRSSDGWEMVETDGPTGNPERFVFMRLVWNVLFNVAHLVGWFVVLCLILRFQWGHAIGLAIVLWIVFTLTLVPMGLSESADIADKRQQAATIRSAQ